MVGGTEIKMAALIHFCTCGVATYLVIILAFIAYCAVRDRTPRHGRDAYVARTTRHRRDDKSEWAAGF
jgi:hypothetical protein